MHVHHTRVLEVAGLRPPGMSSLRCAAPEANSLGHKMGTRHLQCSSRTLALAVGGTVGKDLHARGDPFQQSRKAGFGRGMRSTLGQDTRVSPS